MAPILIFAFNRLDSLKNTVDSLLQNDEAKDSELSVFVDGARPSKIGEKEKVREVQKYVKSITGFKKVTCSFSETNKGLAPSIIKGVSDIIEKYGKVIVLEDDLIVSVNFLSFMNQGLDRYEHDSKVFSICGYTNKIKVPEQYAADAYFCTRSSSWGWATWADRWNSVDWELKDWEYHKKNAKAFNKWGGSDCFRMLESWKYGKNSSWAIRFCYNEFLQDKLSLFPIISKVMNDGFDGNGTNCHKWSRFKCIFDVSVRKRFYFPESISVVNCIYKSAMSYHSFAIRILSRIMYKVMD